MEYQQGLERNLENNIQTMLEKVIGQEKVIARVSATLNLKQVQKTEEFYDPNVTAVRSEQVSKEKSNGLGGIPAGAASKAQSQKREGASPANSNSAQKHNETINYEINKVTRHVVEPVGTVERLSVAVLVDGTYIAQPGSDEKEYVPRTEEEMRKYEALVRGVIGFDERRGDQVHLENIPMGGGVSDPWFKESETGDKISPAMVVILRYVIVFLFGVLFLFFFIRPLMKWMTETPSSGYPATVSELESALKGNLLTGLGENRKQEIREQLQKLITENPALASGPR
jgi:flagellar M-ring protein FliF